MSKAFKHSTVNKVFCRGNPDLCGKPNKRVLCDLSHKRDNQPLSTRRDMKMPWEQASGLHRPVIEVYELCGFPAGRIELLEVVLHIKTMNVLRSNSLVGNVRTVANFVVRLRLIRRNDGVHTSFKCGRSAGNDARTTRRMVKCKTGLFGRLPR